MEPESGSIGREWVPTFGLPKAKDNFLHYTTTKSNFVSHIFSLSSHIFLKAHIDKKALKTHNFNESRLKQLGFNFISMLKTNNFKFNFIFTPTTKSTQKNEIGAERQGNKEMLAGC